MDIFPNFEEHDTDGEVDEWTDVPTYRLTFLKKCQDASKKGRKNVSLHFIKFQAKRDRKLHKNVHPP